MVRQTQALRVGLAAAALGIVALAAVYVLTRRPESRVAAPIEASASPATATASTSVAGASASPQRRDASLPVTVKRIQPTEPAQIPRRISVRLSEEPAAQIEVRPYRLPSIARPERLADVYGALRTMAEAGDASAAYGLHRWLGECQFAFADAKSLDQAVDKLRKEGVMTFPASSDLANSSRRPVRRGENAAAAETAMTQVYAFCEGITPEQKQEAPSWLEKAASSGELYALRAQADEWLKNGDRTRFTTAYEELWAKHGYSGSLSPLAVMYRRGVAGGDPDYVRSYAYQLTELRLVQAVYGASEFPSHRNMLMGIENALSNTASYLTPQQTADAVRMSDRWLRTNPRCCIGLLFGATYE